MYRVQKCEVDSKSVSAELEESNGHSPPPSKKVKEGTDTEHSNGNHDDSTNQEETGDSEEIGVVTRKVNRKVAKKVEIEVSELVDFILT